MRTALLAARAGEWGMNEKRSEDLAELIHERKDPKICRKHPRIVCFDDFRCPVCQIEMEVPRGTFLRATKEFLAQLDK